jgi:hypothetical protein
VRRCWSSSTWTPPYLEEVGHLIRADDPLLHDPLLHDPLLHDP